MFSTQTQNHQPKSEFQSKRQSMHNARASEERQKIKKTIRFSNLSQLLITKNQKNAHFIVNLPLDAAHQTLCQMLSHRDFVTLCLCLIQLQKRPNIKHQFCELVPPDFMHHLVQSTMDMMYQPQIIGIYKCLTSSCNEFHSVMFQYPQTVRNLLTEIKRMKGGAAQDMYLQVLENICPSYAKRCQEDRAKLFGEIFEMLQSSTIQFEHGLNILCSLSPFINSEIYFSSSIIERLLIFYEKHKNSKNQYQLLQKIYLVLTKIIYYIDNCDIISYWRMMEVILHASDVLRDKLVNGYNNVYLLIAKLIERIGNFEMCELADSKVQEVVCRLIEQYKVDYLYCGKVVYQVTTILINHLLKNTQLIGVKQFNASYLYLFSIITKYCDHSILMPFYLQNQFLDFLVSSADHLDVNVSSFALQTLVFLLDTETDKAQIIIILKDYCNLVPLLEQKMMNQNPTIVKKATLILEKFEEFAAEH